MLFVTEIEQLSLNRKYCFSQRVVNVWNNLTSEAVNADNICIFKSKIKSCNFDKHCVYKVNE